MSTGSIRFSVLRKLVALSAGFSAASSIALAQLSVISTSPTGYSTTAPRTTPVSVTFDRAVDTSTFTPANFHAFGKVSGPIAGAITFSNANQTVTLTPSRSLFAGESVMLVMSNQLRGADASPLRAGGYSFEFTARASGSPAFFRQREVVSNRVGGPSGPQTRIYGGLACDLNHDGFGDMTTINEVSSDLRVMLNRADGSGRFGPLISPFTPIPIESSPNEVADFDSDGNIDVVTSAFQTGQIAVCFGNGDGTFRIPVTVISTGSTPRGFGILDANGDGKLDITVANAGSNTVSIIISNGNGSFQPIANMPVSGGPYGMMAADMNRDGLMDLVVGCRDSSEVKLLRGNGNGTFTTTLTSDIGGQNWVVMCNDLNADGLPDISAANSFSANGSTLLNTGNFSLAPVVVQPIGGHTVSTDLADLDGDGDMDWILSSFGAGLWYIYLNDGAGHFTPLQQVIAPNNPSCSVPMDLDNDGDMDLVLTDEIADVLVLMANVCPADMNTDNAVSVQDIFDFLNLWFSGNDAADFNNANGVTVQDIFDFLAAWFSPC